MRITGRPSVLGAMLWDAPELLFQTVSCDMLTITTATTTKQHILHHLHSICRCRYVTDRKSICLKLTHQMALTNTLQS